MSLAGAGAVALGFALDALVAEPPVRAHPVAWLGRFLSLFDREWRRPLVVGVLLALCIPLAAATIVGVTVAVSGVVGPFVAGLALFVTTSRRMLLDTASEVVALTETDLLRAREQLRTLAGRDASTLSAGQVRSAAVESAAENLADGLVAPLLAFTVLAPLSLSAGAAGASWVKAVNTLDSMFGYEHRPVGTASALLDDGVMWLPARVSALLLALTAGSLSALADQRAWHASVPSPNSGWPMGTLAAVIECRFEKPGVYTLNPDAPLPSTDAAQRGVRTVALASALAFGLAVGTLVVGETLSATNVVLVSVEVTTGC